MKLNMLALAISSQYANKASHTTAAVDTVALHANNWLEEHRRVMQETSGRYATVVIKHV